MIKKKSKGSYQHMMGSPIDPSGMAVHSMPDATDPYSGGQLAIPGTVPGGMSGAYTPSGSE